ncbi:peptide-N4-(N-acetyl-beta- glucosaminyl)asparagine amidase [Ptychographa xylographoides]|nr:peptide-N4-(N-acetyl-beta- glucosaminyl)asparagine amidase [Ptychographa xylographoides]
MIALLAQYWSRFLSSTALPKAGPHYPDPERSVGVWYRKMGLQECWEAIGPARDIYLRPLSREIRSALEDRIEFLYQGESVTRPVTFSVYMIGRTKTTARPTIMFCCESPGPRRRARQVINDSALLQRYPGFTLGDSSFPPDYDRPPIRLGMDGKQDSSSDLYAQPAVLDDFLADVHRVGIDVNLAGDGSSHKATIGGIVRLGDISYAITVSHVFKQPPDVGRASADCEFEFDLDTDNYMSGDATSSIEITSRGSKTPESLASGDYTDSVSDLSDVDNLLVTTIVASPNEVSDGYIPPSTTQGTNEAYSALINDTQIRIKLGYQGFDSSPKDVLGNLAMSSINGSHSGLDWALVEIRLPHVLGMLGAYSNTSPPQPQRVAISGPKNARVIARTRSAGVMKGLLSGTPTFTTAPGSQTFQEVWTVALDGPIAEGDCGSWIVDAITGDLYGHIVSGSPESGKAYIVPAYQVFEDIKRQTGADLAFPKTTNDMLGISIGKQGHFTSDYGNSQSISNATISYPIAAPVAVISLLGVVALRLFFLSRGSEWSELLYVVFLLPLLLFAAAVIPESLPLLSTSPSHLKRRHPTDSTSDYISLITNLGESALYWSLQCLGMAFLTNYITRVAVSFLPATQPFTTNLASGMVPGLFAITIFSNTVGIKIYGRFESVVTWLKIVFLFALWTSSRFEHGPIVPGISLSHFLLPETGSLQVVENYVFAYGNLDITYNTILQSHIARDMLIAWTIMTLAVYVMIGLYITEEIVSFRQSSQIPKWFRQYYHLPYQPHFVEYGLLPGGMGSLSEDKNRLSEDKITMEEPQTTDDPCPVIHLTLGVAPYFRHAGAAFSSQHIRAGPYGLGFAVTPVFTLRLHRLDRIYLRCGVYNRPPLLSLVGSSPLVKGLLTLVAID